MKNEGVTGTTYWRQFL